MVMGMKFVMTIILFVLEFGTVIFISSYFLQTMGFIQY